MAARSLVVRLAIENLHPSWRVCRACSRVHSSWKSKSVVQFEYVSSRQSLGHVTGSERYDEDIKPKFLIWDRDRIFPDTSDMFWKDAKARPIKIPPCAPIANAFCESFIGTLKRECLNHSMCFSEDPLDENLVPKTEGQVRCRTELRGIIREYYRDAA